MNLRWIELNRAFIAPEVVSYVQHSPDRAADVFRLMRAGDLLTKQFGTIGNAAKLQQRADAGHGTPGRTPLGVVQSVIPELDQALAFMNYLVSTQVREKIKLRIEVHAYQDEIDDEVSQAISVLTDASTLQQARYSAKIGAGYDEPFGWEPN